MISNKISGKKTGFTLIELLVVISIIGMLSTIVLASVNNARSRGAVAAGLSFSAYNHQALGADAWGYWNFNETGNTFFDTSGNGLDISSAGNLSVHDTTDAPNRSGASLKIPSAANSNVGALFTTNAKTIGATNGYTTSAWIEPSAGNISGQRFVYEIYSPTSSRSLWMDTLSGGTLLSCGGPNGQPVTSVPYVLQVDVWQHVACTYNANSHTMSYYVNGKFIGSSSLTVPPNAYTTDTITAIGIGTYTSATGPVSNPGIFSFIGHIDDLAFYTQPLLASDIAHIYAMEAPAHNLAEAK